MLELLILVGAGAAMLIWITWAIPPEPPGDTRSPDIGANLDYIPAWRRHTIRIELWATPPDNAPEPEKVRLN